MRMATNKGIPIPNVLFEQQPPQYRILITSLPKVGKYLVAEILKAIGYQTTGMHLFDLGFTDYSQATLEQARTAPTELHREMELSVSMCDVRRRSRS